MKTQTNPSHKITPIEGLRGYLALAVILQHLIGEGGYGSKHPILGNIGSLAVKCFIIISGFVIFFLIDTRSEPYPAYITRRFFRIFPIMTVLFTASIFCSILGYHSVQQLAAMGWRSPQDLAVQTQGYLSCWQYLPFHVLAHLTALHGLIPDRVLPFAPVAFLGPAWSLSLEWQFYLIAPLWYCFFTTESIWKKTTMYAFCLICILCSNHFFSWYNFNRAAVPFYIEYFFFGIISYFLYKTLLRDGIRTGSVFPVVVLISLAVYKSSGRGMDLFPFLFWASFFALILEPPTSVFARYVTPVFTNPISLWLGKISYSIYLSHALVLIVVQWALLSLFPHATKAQNFLMLASLTIAFTILASAILYYSIEAPFIKLGSRVIEGKTIDAFIGRLIPLKNYKSEADKSS